MLRPSRKGWWSALLVSALALAGPALPARAQVLYEDARRDLGLAPDPIARSPRLLGMGRLSLVLPDEHTRVNLWDFAGNPAGVLAADSVSELSIRPATWSASSARDVSAGGAGGELQDFAGRENRVGYEVWRRSGRDVAVGAIGSVAQLTTHRPYDERFEQSSHFSEPTGTIVLNARLPFLTPDRMTYALRARFGTESFNDEFRLETRNAAGVWLDRGGQLGSPPDFFGPDERDLETAGAGLHVSYRLGDGLTAAVGGDWFRERIESRNQGDRYLASYDETRPYALGQASLAGRLGTGLEWAADGRAWNTTSDVTYVFTLSSGIGGVPTIGRGDMLDREERGQSLRSRARWTLGAVELGGSFGTWYRKVEVTPPPLADAASYNRLISNLYAGARTDSVFLPDTVRANTTEQRVWDAGGGLAWRVSPRASYGVEFHAWSDALDQALTGEGPNRVGWDVRAGAEWALTPVLSGRGGYLYRWNDRDDLREQSEYKSHAATAGLGLRPAGSSWTLDSGYEFEWGQADFGSPARPRFTRQALALQLRWVF